jgi:hypothetical protein
MTYAPCVAHAQCGTALKGNMFETFPDGESA